MGCRGSRGNVGRTDGTVADGDAVGCGSQWGVAAGVAIGGDARERTLLKADRIKPELYVGLTDGELKARAQAMFFYAR